MPRRRRRTGASSTGSSSWRDLPMATVATAWLLGKAGVTAPIVGASKPGHLQDAVRAIEVKLSPEEVLELEDGYVPHPVLGFS